MTLAIIAIAVVLTLAVIRLAWQLDQAQARIDALEVKASGFNARLVDLETDKTVPPLKPHEDEMPVPQSWLAQQAAAERGEGVRI